MYWDRATLHVPIWVAFFTFGWKFGGGGAPIDIEPTEETVVVEEVIEEVVDREYQLCGQYGLFYWEPPEVPGFYNCLKQPRKE